MSFLTYGNRGTVIESLMSNTAEYYRNEGIAYFRKAHPEYSHISKKNKSSQSLFSDSGENCQIKIISKGDLDYYGVYKGKYVSIELKETKQPFFSLALLKKHQFSQMGEIEACGGTPLLLVHFLNEGSALWLITLNQLSKLQEKSKKFNLSDLRSVGAFEMKIVYPYILNLSETLDLIFSHSQL